MARKGLSTIRNLIRLLLVHLLLVFEKINPTEGVPILYYHSISSGESTDGVPLEVFQEQINALVRCGYRVIRLEDLIEMLRTGKPIGRKTTVITFDDGYKDVFNNVFPLMNAHGFPFAVFVVTDLIGKQKWHTTGTWRWQDEPDGKGSRLYQFLSVSQIRQMCQSGVGVYSHTKSHRDLTSLSDDELIAELRDSAEEVRAITGKEARIFCYPKGKWSPRVWKALFHCQYLAACSTEAGVNDKNTNLMMLKRNIVEGKDKQIRISAVLDRQVFFLHQTNKNASPMGSWSQSGFRAR